MVPENFKTIIIHGGTNDCTRNEHVTAAAKTYQEMITAVKTKAPESKLIISTICPRLDKVEHQERVDKLNSELKDVATKSSCTVIDNDSNFKLSNSDCDDTLLNRGGLHLSARGTRKLLMNFNNTHKVIKSPPNSNRDNESRNTPPRHNVHHSRGHQRRRSPGTHPGAGDHHTRSHNYGRGNRGCHFCGEQNHHKKDCGHGRPITCHACGQLGHKQGQNLCNSGKNYY